MHLLILKIVGFAGIFTSIAGIITAFCGFGDFESHRFMIGSFVSAFGLMVGYGGIVTGFAPEIANARTKSAKYIQEATQEDLSAISTSAESISDAVSTAANAANDEIG